MKELIFATNNPNKVLEIKTHVSDNYCILSLKDLGLVVDVEETEHTIQGNARKKASAIYALTSRDCFADDTGLEVKALGGKPGVHSARYSGPEGDSGANVDKLLNELRNELDRSAQFRTVICLISDGNEYLFEGIVTGKILKHRLGKNGFGYDPVFIPDGFDKSFGQMSLDEKNQISHRARAFDKLVAFLNSH